MGLSDTLRKNTYREDFEGLAREWQKTLEFMSTREYAIESAGIENACIKCYTDTVAGYLCFNYRSDDNYILTPKLQISHVGVPYYDSVRDAKALNQAKSFVVEYYVPSRNGEQGYRITPHKHIQESKKAIALYTTIFKYKCFARSNNRSPWISLFTSEEDAFKAAHIIKSCDDGGFKKYEVAVQKIELPEYAESYVSKIIQPYHSGFFMEQPCKYEVDYRTVGKITTYAVYVDIRW